jgi:capsular polysaccharide biosynthesis protein
MTNTLRLLGFSSSDWAEWDGDSAVASRLVVPQLNNYHDRGVAFDPQGRKWVSKEMKQRIDMSNSDFPARIFTSRQGHGSREIVNYDEVKEVLEEFDITPIRPEELPLDDQIRLFDQANIIVGPFGANLTNIIFSEDSTVVEIFPNDDIRPVFYITANEQGLDYDYIVGEPRTTIDDDNIYVNTSKIHEMLSNIIS